MSERSAAVSLALTTLILRALSELGAPAAETDELAVAGWRLALVVAARREWPDSYTRHYARQLALTLAAGDLDGAEYSALWIAEPGAAMKAAVARVNGTQPPPAPPKPPVPAHLAAATTHATTAAQRARDVAARIEAARTAPTALTEGARTALALEARTVVADARRAAEGARRATQCSGHDDARRAALSAARACEDAAQAAHLAVNALVKPAPANDAPFTLTAATLPELGIEKGPRARRARPVRAA